jgi:hypothetical protein
MYSLSLNVTLIRGVVVIAVVAHSAVARLPQDRPGRSEAMSSLRCPGAARRRSPQARVHVKPPFVERAT